MLWWLKVVFFGMCVGAADIVPGISGGTVAFLLGIYEELLTSIKALNWRRVPFLSAFLIGIAVSFVSFAKWIRLLLAHETGKVFLYAGFLGLVVGSIFFCMRHFRLTANNLFFLLIGASIAFFLSEPHGGLTLYTFSGGVDWWVIACGGCAISAMLLPGISGSYLLQIVGMYGAVLAALVDAVDGLREWQVNREAFQLLANMAVGIGVGALFFSRVVSFLLARYRGPTMAFLTGCMIGALPVVWPFSTMPSVTSVQFLWPLGFFMLGLALVLVLEYRSQAALKQS